MVKVTPQSQPDFNAIVAARIRIAKKITYTPLLENLTLNASLGVRILFKAEVLQRTGSFKARGAFHFLNRLGQMAKNNHFQSVVAYSSGNHAQAVAAAAADANIPACIVMPSDAPRIKIEKTRAYGAEVILYNRQTESREAIAAQIAQERNAVLVPPYDHPDIIAGQGTLALELIEQTRSLGLKLDHLLIPCSGGGLAAGCGLVFQEQSPQTRLYAVEPEGYNDTQLSLQAGQRKRIHPDQPTLCDALMLPEPGALTFPINQACLSGAYTVTDAQVIAAMQLAMDTLKLVLEPGGAVALAAAIAQADTFSNQAIGVILSGGNIDNALYSELLQKTS